MITIVKDSKYGDWIAFYKDGKLLGQGHSFYTEDILEMLGIEYECVDGNSDETGNSFPKELSDVVTRT